MVLHFEKMLYFAKLPHISLMNRPQTLGYKYLSSRYQTHILLHDLTFCGDEVSRHLDVTGATKLSKLDSFN